MKFAAISTVPNIKLSKHGTMNMALAQHVDDEQYANYFRNSSKHTIMDNGACEGEQIEVSKVEDLAHKINADDVVVHDSPYDMKETLELVDVFFDEFQHTEDFNFVGVPQGSNAAEWIDCFKAMCRDDRIDVIGLSKLSIPVCFEDVVGTDNLMLTRLSAIQHIVEYGYTDKPVHVLGLDEPIELAVIKKYPFIRSCDSCLPILCGKEGINIEAKYTGRGVKPIRPNKDFDFEEDISTGHYRTIRMNIEFLKRCAVP